MAAVFMANADALVLGEIQVNSTLGQPLSARIAFVDLSDVDALQLKIRLAGSDEYNKLGLQFPDGHKFRFQVVNEQGAILPFIRIITSHPIDDPFVNLLVEVSSPAGKLIKAYTFLLDPPLDSLRSSDAEPSVTVEHQEVSPSVTTAFGKGGSDQAVKPVKSAVKRTRHHARKTVQAEPQLGRSRMKLAMSLSISSYDPSAQTGANRDALQEELIAKEKALQDLNLQIGEMQTVIKSLQEKQGITAYAASAVPAEVPHSASPVSVAVQPPATPIIWLNSVLAFAALVLGGVGWGWYRKYRRMHEWQHGPFDDLHEEPPAEITEQEPVYVKPDAPHVKMLFPTRQAPFTSLDESTDAPSPDQSPAASAPLQFEKVALPIGEQSVEVPAYTEHTPIVPPEYALLMEANRYLRAGNDQQAEDALIQAIHVNSKNLYGYQALLRIYEKRGDTKRFENMALQIKQTGDEDAFNEAAEQGRKLDPDNPLYA